MKKTYNINIAGVSRDLTLYPVSDKISIAALILLGDVEFTEVCARELLKVSPEFDYIITPEAKSISLAHEMAKQAGCGTYFVARKHKKVYLENALEYNYESITTKGRQSLYLGQADAELMKDKKIVLIDDVISTGESLNALRALVEKAGGIIAGCAAVLAEGDAAKRNDIIFLKPLPLFNASGYPI
ncbi:MAG: adenine phosphoribosyltransferase [Clostridia bacterium]|nr:adenine phosphoribosyltransferase [Clostridia bacterium]